MCSTISHLFIFTPVQALWACSIECTERVPVFRIRARRGDRTLSSHGCPGRWSLVPRCVRLSPFNHPPVVSGFNVLSLSKSKLEERFVRFPHPVFKNTSMCCEDRHNPSPVPNPFFPLHQPRSSPLHPPLPSHLFTALALFRS